MHFGGRAPYLFKAWCKEVVHQRKFSFSSEAGFGGLEEQESFTEGNVFQNQRVAEVV